MEQFLLIRVITLKEGKQIFWVCGAKQCEPDTLLVPARSAGPVGVWMCGGRFIALLSRGSPRGRRSPFAVGAQGSCWRSPSPAGC